MPIRVRVTADRASDALRQVTKLTEQELLIGIPANSAARTAGQPITNAQIGYIQEFGAPGANIPPRPFLIPGVEAVRDKCVGRLKDAAIAALGGGNVIAGFTAAGLIAQSAVRNRINDGIPPPLKPSTLANRKRSGFKGTKPLVVTGSLRNAITYVLRNKRDP